MSSHPVIILWSWTTLLHSVFIHAYRFKLISNTYWQVIKESLASLFTPLLLLLLSLSHRLKKNLKMFFIVHPSWFIRTLLGITRPFIRSHSCTLFTIFCVLCLDDTIKNAHIELLILPIPTYMLPVHMGKKQKFSMGILCDLLEFDTKTNLNTSPL